jgi:serine/threonine protein phosphatase PrpC
MFDHFWKTWGASVIGPLHRKIGLPNQDSWMARRYKWGNVLVVSDGLGSKVHSDRGSKAACLAVFDAAKCYQKYAKSDFNDILRFLHASWLVRLAPHSPGDCSATCLFAMQIGEKITIGRIGDGMIAVTKKLGFKSVILSDDKQNYFSNQTDCLDSAFIPDKWESKTIDASECEAIVLCTDGIADDLILEERLNFAQNLESTYRNMDAQKRSRDLSRWLNTWPVPGHSDDKTIACLYKIEGLL